VARSYFFFAFFFAFFFTTFFFAFFFAAMLHLPCSLGDTIGQRPQRPNPLPGYKATVRFSIENQKSIRQRVPIDVLGARPTTRSRIRSTRFGDETHDARCFARRARNPHGKRTIVVSHHSSRSRRASSRVRSRDASRHAARTPIATLKIFALDPHEL
jgi:hypothetical protein